MTDIARASIVGVRTTLAATVASGIVQLVILMVLARLLQPADFGAYVIVTTLARLTTLFLLGAVERTLIIRTEFASLSGLWLPIVMAVLAIAIAVSAVFLVGGGLLDGTGMRTDIVVGVMLTSALSALSVAPRVHLRRQLKFGAIAVSELTAQVAGLGIVSALAAVLGMGPLALVLGAAAYAAISAAVLLWVTRWPVVAAPAFASAAKLIRASGAVAKSSALEILTGQLPTMVVSAGFGTSGLGTFNRAYTITQLPIELLTNSMSKVLVSGFVAVQSDAARLKQALRTLVRVSSAVTTPVAAGMLAAHTQLAHVVLGPRWTESGDLIAYLVPATWAVMAGHLFGIFAEATLRLDHKVRIQAVSLVLLLACLLIGSQWGLAGAALGMAVGSVPYFVLYLLLAARATQSTVSELGGWFLPGLGAGVLCAGYAALVPLLLPLGPTVVLGLQIGGCGLLCVGYYFLFHRELFRTMHRFSGLPRLGALP